MPTLRLLILAIAGMLCAKTYSAKELNFRSLDVKSGLSDNYVQGITQDCYGFIWIATLDGLNRYDGYRVKTYEVKAPDAYNNDIKAVKEDASGTLWIRGASGYYAYDRERDVIDGRTAPILERYGIKGKPDFMAVDNDRNLWCRTGDSLHKYDFPSGTLLTVPMRGHADRRILRIESRKDEAFLLFDDGEIARIDWQLPALRAETERELKARVQYSIRLDTSGRLWFYASHYPGLAFYDTKLQKWTDFSMPGLDNALITALEDDGEGGFWIGTDNKGACLVAGGKAEWFGKEHGNRFALPDNHVNCIFKDRQNTVWIGTGKLGAAYANPGKTAFKTVAMPGQEDVKCLQEDKEGNLWIGFDGEGLVCLRSDGRTERFRKKDGNVPSDMIICSFLDSEGRLWFGSYGDGPFYKGREGFVRISHSGARGNRPLQRIRRITEDKEGTVWFATFMEGLYAMRKDGSFAEYSMWTSPLRTNSVTDLSYSGGDFLYAGTSSGLYRIGIRDRSIAPVEGTKDGRQPLPDTFITCLLRDSRGLLWIGTRKGLAILDERNDRILCLTEDNGLSHNHIQGIAEDKRHNLWVTTDNGVTRIAVSGEAESRTLRAFCSPFFKEDGTGDLTFNLHSILCRCSGEVLMGGIGAYLQTYPRNVSESKPCSKVMFTHLLLNERAVNPGDTVGKNRVPLPKNLQLLEEITLDHSDSNFTLEVSSMDYPNLHKQAYAYRLGDAGQWIKMEGNQIHFNRLAPGDFPLQVKLYEAEGSETNPISTLTVHVRPPFWQSAEAFCLYAAAIALVFLLAVRRIQKKHRLTLERQTRELEIAQQHELDEARMRFFTNVSHDLRTPLSLISIPLKKILSSEVPSGIRKELELIQRNTITLLNEVNQLLDFRKLDKQREQYLPSFGNLTEFVKDIYGTFREMSAQSGIQMSLKVISPDIETSFDKDKMQRILLNLLSNAVKYNRKGGRVTVVIDKIAERENVYARIQVADTGIGIKEENKEKVFERFFQEQHATTYMGSGIGLHIVKEYVKMHQGTIRIEDNAPEGSIFIVSIPIVEGEETETCADEKEEALPPETAAPEQQVSILIVEDNDDFRHFMTGCLQPHYRMFEASNGKEALEVLAKQNVEMVICDVMMPVMDGMELCRRIKTDIRFSHIPVIMLTAKSADEHILSGLKEGADDYITKPFNLDILMIRIQKLLNRATSNREKFKTIDLSPSEITVSTLDEELVKKAIRIVEENMDNSEFSVEDFSAQIGVSRSGLYKKLMSITGKSPLEFIRILRVKRGRQLLEQSQLSISQVAYQVGLSPKQFAKYFKELYGHLPSDHAKLGRQEGE